MKPGRNHRAELLLAWGGSVVVVVSAFAGPGCGTMMNQERARPRIYGGVREDLRYFPLSIVDLPCSVVGDTFMLPWDARSHTGETNKPRAKP